MPSEVIQHAGKPATALPGGFDPAPFLKTLTHRPGVYRMLDVGGVVLYVGKAKDLKQRVSSYFRKNVSSARIRSMVAQIAAVEITVTNTEAEALILENNLIKAHRPRYNVLLRDDKSYPYIYVSTADRFARISFHRGSRKHPGRFFGPYPSAGAVRETLSLLQRLFRVRQCEDSFFANRSRPCLQYQIKRCTAPCVGYIDEKSYAADMQRAVQFLEGRSDEVIHDLVQEMEQAAQALAYERAAQLRDQIEMLRQISARQYVSGSGERDVDIVAVASEGGAVCVQVFFIRGGHNLGNKSLFPRVPDALAPGELMQGVLGQYYLEHKPPGEIILSHAPVDQPLMEEMLTAQAGRRVTLSSTVRGERARWLELAERNAREALHARNASRAGVTRRLEALQEALELDAPPVRLECFDISHTRGEATVASCVVFGSEGPVKADYRRFNIEGITPGDDYAAMHQALTRRYTRLRENEGVLPDVLLIDGGRGQVAEAEKVLTQLQIDQVMIVGVTKGEGRRPELDTLTLSGGGGSLRLPSHSPALHLVQQIRDEAHRFAITGHRQRRTKARTGSPLQQIPGLGPRRRQQLLKHFGGLRSLTRAGVDELARVPGISRSLAEQVYAYLHHDT
ncbi:excinuclease ABC subunit UvrC [Acidihalobacter ferrooxydans]|uniref:UvrABC system protein C n=1 Tax=Acidihalobacter ferrooxydans TaxID=1765967 RepID=A0A1P8UFQ1_9GAMM|nr:excinuclease ABC subunit UvrC [Acidihalobacter ferrooxydans]APZ42672.1 excinuclease ABC subunit C [Acidihalobacter ferrooxydans]